FIERSTASNSFTFSRAVGINFDDHSKNERVWWGYGIFRPSLSDAAAIQDNKGYLGVVRIAGLPIKGKTVNGAPHILQIGVSFQYRDNRSNEVTLFRARTTNNLGEHAIDTGTIASGSATIVGFEIAWVRGPVSVQSELFLANVDGNMGNPDSSFTGWYVQVSYWITGESRRWKTSVFSRVTPNANAFDGSGGKGAWEIALLFDNTDLNDVDNGVNGNEWTGYTLGLNWHWNPNTRAMFNYVNGNLDDTLTDGTIHAIMFRLQVDF
ncbi:MAG: porin, partial [Planctomycetota bacterium]